MPPIPPIPPIPPSARSVSISRHVVRVGNDHMPAIPTRAEIDAMVPIIEVTEGKGCSPGKQIVNTSERRITVDGQMRQKISIQICSKEHQRQVRAEAVRGLQEARKDILREDELSPKTRDSILANLDKQIARLRAGKD